MDREPELLPAPPEDPHAVLDLPEMQENPQPELAPAPPPRDILIAQTIKNLLTNHECDQDDGVGSKDHISVKSAITTCGSTFSSAINVSFRHVIAAEGTDCEGNICQ